MMCVVIFSCEEKNYVEVESNGNIITKVIELPSFSGIKLDSKCKVFLKNGQTQKVTVKISDNLFSQINNVVTNNIWEIDFSDNDNIASINKHVWEITVESPNIKYIENNGAGSLTCLDKIKTDSLYVKHISSGSTKIVCNTSNLKIVFDGSGKLDMIGNSNSVSLNKEGSGHYNAFELEVNSYNINKEGSGNLFLKANSQLNVFMDGGGSIYYKGNPKINKTVEGSGNLLKAE